jgi:hypothetical protein
MTDIKVFWHCNELSGWNHVMDQQWDLIEKSGLEKAASEINICMNGQPWTFEAWDQQKNASKLKKKTKLISVNKDAAFHEWPTLTYLHQQAKENGINNPTLGKTPYYICYIHLKGLLRWGDPNVGDWRDFMNWATIEQWRDNVEALDEGAQVVGTNYNTEPWPHFAGNFWWSKSDYIATLDPLFHPEDRLNRAFTQFKPHPTNPHWRFDHEAWLHSKGPDYVELARSLEPGERHYRERYPRENYVKVDS